MGQAELLTIGVIMATLIVVLIPTTVLYLRALRDVASGMALVIHRPDGTNVSFTRAIVLPFVHRAELMDISVKTIEIDRRGREGLSCRDGIRADVKATFFIRVNNTHDDVLKVAQCVGAERAGDQAALEELFAGKLGEGLKTVAASLDFEQMFLQRDSFKDAVLEVIGHDLNGYVLDDLAIDFLEQTPIEQLDPNNLRDAEGIKKITEITSARATETAETRMESERKLAKLTVELETTQIELERTVGDALGRFTQDTGRTLTREQLEQRLVDRMREVVEAVLDERQGS